MRGAATACIDPLPVDIPIDPAAREELRRRVKREQVRRLRENRIAAYYPDEGPLRRELYPKHIAFLQAGATHKVRSAIAANRVGKTEGMGGYEVALHLTGKYPAWWKGKRFAKPVRAWVAGDTGKTTRDILQEKLLGPKEAHGTGLIPGDSLDRASVKAKPGVPDAVESCMVRHVSGGWSRLVFKSYDQGREAFQGTEQEVILLDEECPLDIFSECLLRLMTTGGILMMTFTPLQGVTPLIKHLRETGIYEIAVTWDDVPHLSEQDKAEILKNTPAYLRDARSKGVPLMGSGLVFAGVPEEDIVVPPFDIPKHFRRMCGIDFGWDHPTAAVEIAFDADADCVYVTKCARMRETPPVLVAAAVKPWGAWLPWAWPHDGRQSGGKFDAQDQAQLAEMYRKHGLDMLPIHAQFEDGSNGVEPGIQDMLERMLTRRWRVFANCGEWLEEFRNYHRDEGVIVKLMDDVISASRYAFMMKRFAKTKPFGGYVAPMVTVGDSRVGY